VVLHQSWAKPGVVVQVCRYGLHGIIRFRWIGRQADLDPFELAKSAASDVFAAPTEMSICPRPLLTANLQDTFRLRDGAVTGATFSDAYRQRFLQPDVLAGKCRGGGWFSVLVIGCADDHGVNVGAGEDFLVVAIHVDLRCLLRVSLDKCFGLCRTL